MFIDLCNELIGQNGELYATALSIAEVFTSDREDTPSFTRQYCEELQQLYVAANTLLYKQLADLKAYRTKCSFEALADENIARIRAAYAASRKKKDEQIPATEQPTQTTGEEAK